MLDEVTSWYKESVANDPLTAVLVGAAFDFLEEYGPPHGLPKAVRVPGSSFANLKELRPGSSGRSERVLFAFDPKREAVLLVAGDKSGNWQRWYTENIPVAERRFETWLKNLRNKGD